MGLSPIHPASDLILYATNYKYPGALQTMTDADELTVDNTEAVIKPSENISSAGNLPGAVVARIARALSDSIWDLRIIILLCAGYIVSVELVLWYLTGSTENGLSGLARFGTMDFFISEKVVTYFEYKVVPFFVLIGGLGAARVLYEHIWLKKNEISVADKIIILLKNLASLAPWMRTLVFITIFIIFSGSFAAFKFSIPEIIPYSWDNYFAEMDKFIHGGVQPWEITWAIFGNNLSTHIIDISYNLWFTVVYAAPLGVLLFDPVRERRNLFLIMHLLLWILLGSAAALMFSSVGPCYFDLQYGGASDFTPLMDNLRAVNVEYKMSSMMLQQLLWESVNGTSGRVLGISAMPSLHVAHVVLLALFAGYYSRTLAWIAWGYVAVVLLGSVHLGWHYAADGYASVALTVALWLIVKKIGPFKKIKV